MGLSNDDAARVFARFPFLREMEEDLMRHPEVVVREFDDQDILLRPGEYIRSIPMVLKGNLKVYRGDSVHDLFLYYLREGEACALTLTSCLGREQSGVRVLADGPVEAVLIPAQLPDEWMGRSPSFRRFVLKTFQGRFDELLEAVDGVAFLKLDERVLQHLRQKAKMEGRKDVEVTHSELAHDLDTSREVVSRVLKELERQGMLELGRKRITILDPS